MDRRDFMSLVALAGGGSALGTGASGADAPAQISTQSRAAFQELLGVLAEIDRRWLSAEWNIAPRDIADGHRTILHLLSAALDMLAEADPERPMFQRLVSPTRK